MKRLLLFALLCWRIYAQPSPLPQVQYVTTAPAGACTVGQPLGLQIVISTLAQWSCEGSTIGGAGTWTAISGGGGGGAAIGGPMTGATDGSSIFAHPAGIFAQDNANYHYNPSAPPFGSYPGTSGGVGDNVSFAVSTSVSSLPSSMAGQEAMDAVLRTSGASNIASILDGLYAAAYHLGSGNVSNMNAAYNDAENLGGGNITGTLTSTYSFLLSTGGLVTHGIGTWSDLSSIGAGTILFTDITGMDVSPPGAGSANVRATAYHNGNMTGVAGLGKDFAWYSEGGTNHLETGAAGYVGIEIERFSGQTSDFQDFLDSDGTTVLGSFDKNANLTLPLFVRTVPVAVASLPTCNGGAEGARASVNNSNAVSFTAGIGAVVAGGGTTHVPVYCDGTNWRIG